MQRISYLDGAKGLCAISVLVVHYCLTFGYQSPMCSAYIDRTCLHLLGGKTAVYVFICLSIYLCLIQLKKKAAKDIILKRYFRIAIPTAVALLLLCGLKICGLLYRYEMPTGNYWLLKDPMSIRDLPYAILESPLGKTNGWLNVAWMLGYILFGTLMAVIAKLALDGMKLVKQIVMLLFFAIVIYHYDIIWLNFFFAYIIFLYKENLSTQKRDMWISIASVILLLVLEFFPRVDLPNILRAFCFVNLILCSINVQKILSWKPIVFLGDISFEVYLLQLPVLFSFSCWLWLCIPNIWINIICTLLVLLILSTLISRYVNAPINKLLNNFVAWIKA